MNKQVVHLHCGHVLHSACMWTFSSGLEMAVRRVRTGGLVEFEPHTKCPICRDSFLVHSRLGDLPWRTVNYIKNFTMFAKTALMTSQNCPAYSLGARQLCGPIRSIRNNLISNNTPLETMLEVITRIMASPGHKFVVCGDCRKSYYVVFNDECGNAEEAAATFTCQPCVERQAAEAAAEEVHVWHHTPATVQERPLRCDNCETPVVRDPGARGLCSHETCPACNYSFCYVCGGSYNGWYTTNYAIDAVKSMPFCDPPRNGALNALGNPRRFGACGCLSREQLERVARERRGVMNIRANPLESFAPEGKLTGFGYEKLSRPFV